MKKLILIGVVALLAACAGTNFKWDNARQIKEGMTESELVKLMGKPYMVNSKNGELIYVWTYVDSFSGMKSVSAVLVDGKVKQAPTIPESF